MEIAILIFEIAVAIVWIQQGIVRYGFWAEGKPSGGFVPVIFASIILVASITILLRVLVRKKKTGTPFKFELNNYIPVIGAVIGAFMIQLVGIAAAVFCFSVVWMHYLSKYAWVRSLVASAIFTAFIYGIFRMWLQVPFPEGYVFELF